MTRQRYYLFIKGQPAGFVLRSKHMSTESVRHELIQQGFPRSLRVAKTNPPVQAFSAGNFAFPQYHAPVLSNPKKGGSMPNKKSRSEVRANLTLTRREAQGYADRDGEPVHILRPSSKLGSRAAPGYRIIADSTWQAHKNKTHYKGCHVEVVKPSAKKRNPMPKKTNGKLSIPKGKKKGDRFTKGGKTYVVQSFVDPRNGKRIRRAMPMSAFSAMQKGRGKAVRKLKRKSNPPVSVAERKALMEAADCPLLSANTRRKLKRILDVHGGKPRTK